MNRVRLILAVQVMFFSLNAGSGLPAFAQALRPETLSRPTEQRLKAIVTKLASREFGGRRGPVAEKTRDYLLTAFQDLGLKPAFDGSYRQNLPGREPGEVLGVNIGGFLEGNDPALKDQWVVLGVHYDHLGVKGKELYPGADDNATGVAMMLEVARSIVASADKPRRSLLLLGFDLEEDGLFGSRYFVEHSPVPLKTISIFITADMIGRSLGGVCPTDVFVMGTEHAPALRGWLKESTPADGSPLDVGLLGSDLLILDRSDYGPFRSRKVPYLFFSTGENPNYHRPTDVPETIDYPKVEAISRLILGVVNRSLTVDESPKWLAPADHPIEEAETIRRVLRVMLEHEEAFKIGGAQEALMRNTLKSLDKIVERRTITPSERTWMVRVARIVLMSIL